MRILRIIRSVNPGGGGPIEALTQQSRAMAKSGIVNEVVSLDDPAEPFVKDFSLPLYPLGSRLTPRRGPVGKLLRHVYYEPRFVPWLRENIHNYDIAVVQGLWNYSALGARRVLVGSGVPYVVFTHGMLDPWFKRTYPRKHLIKQLSWLASEGPLLNGASAVFFTTEEERILARNAFWPYRPKERVVEYGTSDAPGDPTAQIAAFRAHMPALDGRRYLLFLSRIHPKKGCDLLLEAFATVAAANPDLDLVIAGPDRANWLPELTAMADRLGIGHRIHWPGLLQGDLKWGAFRAAEAFILPSHQENFGVVVAEAMAAGRPVLITNKVNIWREVEAMGAGLVENDDLPGTRRLIDRFLAMPQAERDAMGVAGRQGFLERFEVGRTAENIRQAMMEIIARG